MGNNYIVDPVKDLEPVCPNCHAMLHRKDPPYSIEELYGWVAENSPKYGGGENDE
jgi:5-methylcytosine-specific restriction protein A